MTKCSQLKPIHVPASGFRSAYDYYEREPVDNFITEMKEMHNNVVSKLRRCLYVAKANNIGLIDQIEYLYRNKASVHWNNGKNRREEVGTFEKDKENER